MDRIDTALDRTLVGYSKLGYAVRRRGWHDLPAGALRGRVALVTGARSGLGRATVEGLARLGARVHLVVRTREPGEATRGEIERAVPGAELVVDELDVSSLAAVRAFTAAWDGPLDILVHNAGVLPPARTLTPEGHELALATHVLGPHRLTAGLLDHLRASPDGRVIWVTFGGMYAQRLRLDDLEYAHGDYDGTTAYARTKRMQVVLARDWGERLKGD